MSAAPLVALHDCETNGLLRASPGKSVATKVHCLGFKIADQWWSCCDEPAFVGRHGEYLDVLLPSGNFLRRVYHASIAEGLRELSKADLRVGHNSQDFDDRIYRKFFPQEFQPHGRALDTLILSRLLYPVISKQGPNTHKVPGQLRMRHSIEAWGYRLGEKKNKGFDPGDWQTWSEDMQLYMLQDVVCLEKLFKWLMSRKPAPLAVEIEHGFSEVILRQEAWGFTFDYEKALKLAADTEEKIRTLEAELVETFGEWWEPGKVTRRAASSKVKLSGFADVTLPRFSPTTGKRLAKDYVGPPRCHYEAGAPFTPIERVEFNPGSRAHVHKMLVQRYGWRPTKLTEKGAVAVDDEVLRELTYPECEKLADYYAAKKIHGYVMEGKKAWISVAHEEPDDWRMHGRMITIGTYTYRASHMDPNMGQIPTRDPEYGHRCRELFKARKKFVLIGADGSGMQLRLLAHYLAYWDGGTYAGVFERDEDPHEFMRDSIGVDLMGEGDTGRKKGKTLNYALCFGGGVRKLGSIIEPKASDGRKMELGQIVKERMLPVFGTAMDDLKAALKDSVETNGVITGLDGRKARVFKSNAALATLLQMGEGVVMKDALVIFDRSLRENGLRCGVDGAGVAHPELADYEFCANVHDEYQADVRPEHQALYTKLAHEAVPAAGRHLRLKCPLKSDVKAGHDWTDTH